MLKRLSINKFYKFQYEKLKNSYVLLYPEGRINLNDTASEILKLCDGTMTKNMIANTLLNKYDNIEGFDEFLKEAIENNWINEVSIENKEIKE